MFKDEVISATESVLRQIAVLIVANRGAVKVTTRTVDARTTFRLDVDISDVGKVIGRGGRTARSLRILLSGIGKENKLEFSLDIPGHDITEG